MVLLQQRSLAVLLCLVYVPHFSAAFFRRSGLNKRFGEVAGSRPFNPKSKLTFRDNGFSTETSGVKHSSLVLECQVGGTLNPTIHWLKNGQRLMQGNRHTFYDDEAVYEDHSRSGAPVMGMGQTSSRLYLDCLTEDDDGEYTCVAENPTLRIAQSTNVTVVKRDKVLYSDIRSCMGKSSGKGTPARVFMWTASRLEFEGTKIQLYCRAEGYPTPIISWFDVNNEPITEGGQFKIARNGDLIIDDISWFENMGGYTCMAENTFGQDSTTAFVYPMSRGDGFMS